MNAVRTRVVLMVLATLLALGATAPLAAEAGPECLQVYPWSKLCSGDVEGFLCAWLGDPGTGTCDP